MRRYSISIHLFTFSLAFILCLVWCEDRIVYSFMPFSFESMYRLVWGGIGISIPLFSLWFYVLFCVRRDRYIYLPPWTSPLFGARVHYMIQIPHDSQLNKIRILFNSLSLYTHIYTYTTVYHCISCIYSTAYPLHLPLRPDYHTMRKRIQARICSTVYTSCIHQHTLTSAGAQTHYARKSPKKCGYRAILYALYMVYIPLPTTKKHRKKSLT